MPHAIKRLLERMLFVNLRCRIASCKPLSTSNTNSSTNDLYWSLLKKPWCHEIHSTDFFSIHLSFISGLSEYWALRKEELFDWRSLLAYQSFIHSDSPRNHDALASASTVMQNSLRNRSRLFDGSEPSNRSFQPILRLTPFFNCSLIDLF